jgi:hypothetical protein
MTVSAAGSRNIPEDVKRRLRKEGGFGCCICGHPFIEYHHIVPFSQSGTHDPADMMILCPIHHHQCTVNAIDEESQRTAKGMPFNISHNLAEGQLHVTSKLLAVQMGGNQFVGPGLKVVVDQEPLLQIKSTPEGRLLLSLSLYDREDELLLEIVENEWISGDPLPWDLTYSYNKIILRNEPRKIAISLDARSELLTIGGELWRRGQSIEIRAGSLKINGIGKGFGLINMCLVALSLVANTRTDSFAVTPDPRLKGAFISDPDPAERLRKGFLEYGRLVRSARIGRNESCPCGSGLKFKRCHEASEWGKAG